MSNSDEPPLNKANVGAGSRVLSAARFVVRRLAGIWALWDSDWLVPPVRSALHSRCYPVFISIQRGEEVNEH